MRHLLRDKSTAALARAVKVSYMCNKEIGVEELEGDNLINHNNALKTGIFYGSISIFISILGAAVTFPFLQSQRDALQCDALCYGSMQSVRNGMSLLGNIFVGRMSDKYGRIKMLWVGIAASLLSYSISFYGISIETMWLSMIPSSLLNQNFSVFKALFADYNDEIGGLESDRASSMGRLGMAVGVAFMLGPVIGANLLKSYTQAILCASCFTVVAASLIWLLPKPNPNLTSKAKKEKVESNAQWNIVNTLNLPAIRSPGSKLLMFIRLMMGLAFNAFMTVWTVSLKQRFDFGPRDHAFFMGWIGLCYAVSQGLLAKLFIKMAGEDPTIVLLVCICVLSLGRVLAMLTSSLILVYAIMAIVIVALGVVNTALSSACSRLVDSDQIGSLFGVLEATESLAGMIGPALGGLLYKFNPHLPILAVVFCYSLVFFSITFYYRKLMLYTSDAKLKAS